MAIEIAEESRGVTLSIGAGSVLAEILFKVTGAHFPDRAIALELGNSRENASRPPAP